MRRGERTGALGCMLMMGCFTGSCSSLVQLAPGETATEHAGLTPLSTRYFALEDQRRAAERRPGDVAACETTCAVSIDGCNLAVRACILSTDHHDGTEFYSLCVAANDTCVQSRRRCRSCTAALGGSR